MIIKFQQTSEINKTELKSSPNDKNTCYCKELWVYFQKHHLGLPQYQCFQLQDNEFQAQITLPGGNILIGKPYKSAADAYEYLAGKVLKVFNATEATSSQVSHLNLSTPSKALSTNHVENSVETQSNLKEIPLMVIKKRIYYLFDGDDDDEFFRSPLFLARSIV